MNLTGQLASWNSFHISEEATNLTNKYHSISVLKSLTWLFGSYRKHRLLFNI